MKQFMKNISFFTIITLLLFIYPSNAYALIQHSSTESIHNTQNLEIGSLSFSEISFRDYSNTSTQSFGLTGTINNSSKNNISYDSISYYYDSNYNLVAQESNSGIAIPGTSDFNLMSNLNVLNGHHMNEIYYYHLSIQTNDNILPAESENSKKPSEIQSYSNYSYVIDKYNIDIIVNENNTLDIVETITAYYNIPKHGIFRTIPLGNTITRLDGTVSKNRTQISNLSVDHEYKTSKINGNFQIKIGSPDHTLTGEETYIIKYTYNLGKDPMKQYDEFYYNIIGTDWDTVIGNVTFSITMPHDFDSSKLGFSSGMRESIDNRNIEYNVRENVITGNYKGILGAGEALTVRCELPEGYFIDAGLIINYMNYIIFLIPILFVGVSIFLWYKFGRDDKVIETVEFYPPKGLDSLDVGFLYKGSATNKDVTSLLLYLANKGYLQIIELQTEIEKENQENDFIIKKIKDYDGDNLNEKLFMEGLFEFDKTEVTDSMLYNSFYKTNSKILYNMNSRKNKNKIFEKKSYSKRIFIILMIIATYCIITLPPVLEYGELDTLAIALVFPGLGFSVVCGILVAKTDMFTKIFGLLWGLGFFTIGFVMTMLPIVLQDSIYFIGYIVGLICVFCMFLCIKYLSKRTPYGTEILGKLRGFKTYLETVEKDKLEVMVLENPTYFYDVLPYTYVLDVSDKWIKKFETISLEAPNWYDGSKRFDVRSFGTFMDSTMSSAQFAMSSSPSNDSSSSSSSSGGGSSGGGSGGGGGGSW